jgi:hypothetical protein
MLLEPLEIFLHTLQALQEFGIGQLRARGDDRLLRLCTDDTTDFLKKGRTDVGCCEPAAVRDLGNLPDAGTALLELVKDRIPHPRWNGVERKWLIPIHVSSTTSTDLQMQRANPG